MQSLRELELCRPFGTGSINILLQQTVQLTYLWIDYDRPIRLDDPTRHWEQFTTLRYVLQLGELNLKDFISLLVFNMVVSFICSKTLTICEAIRECLALYTVR